MDPGPSGATIISTSGSDVLTGYDGDNNDIIIGVSGINVAVIPALYQQSSVSMNSDAGFVSGPEFQDALTSIDVIRFVDGTIEYDPGSAAAQVTRLYQAALGRAPDPLGLAGWVSQLASGMPLSQIASDFLSSPEFQARFPGAQQDATSFVTQLYANVLGRAPDAAGEAAWVGQLDSGALTEGQVVTGFSESAENQAGTAQIVADGIWVPNENAAAVARLYYSALDRAPDAAGLTSWTNQLESGQLTLGQEADSFMQTAEFFGKYGNLSNQDFVQTLYENVLGRAPDAAGDSAWLDVLNSGAATRAQVLVGFSESSEHQLQLVTQIEQNGIVIA